MIVSWNWLGEYVRLDVPVDVLSARLALSGLNHESTSDVGGDLAIDLEVTSNRPDCLGHIGVAREVSVLFEQALRVPDPRPRTGGEAVSALATVAVEDASLCPRFTARLISGVKVGPSPWRIRKRLETIGVRPISNIVDATNYVMFECGQPLHAYDYDRLEGRRLEARRARAGETLRAINNKVYELRADQLVIADAARPVGLAGVMGGLETEIGAATTSVMLESALFDPISVRRTSRALGLFSPSSYRFERPLDRETTEWASRRCAELILETAGGTLHPGVIDVGAAAAARPTPTLRFAQIARLLGIDVPRERAVAILRALGLELIEETAASARFRVPTWRSDLEREVDLIEEVARIHGYEHIPEDRAVPLVGSARGVVERVEDAVREALCGCGFDEAATFSLVAEPLAVAVDAGRAAGSDGRATLPPIRVDHSSRKLENALRRSLVPSLLAARRHNEARGNLDAELFEIAHAYLPRTGDASARPDEPSRLGIVAGRDFLGVKGVVETLLERLHVDVKPATRPAALDFFEDGRCAELWLGDERWGVVGEIRRAVLDDFEARAAASAAELDFGLLLKHARLVPRFAHLPAQPAVERDLSLVVARALSWSELAATVERAAGPRLEAVAYLDTFRGGNLPDDRESVHFSMRFRHPERTLTGEEVEPAVSAVAAACAAAFGAVRRG